MRSSLSTLVMLAAAAGIVACGGPGDSANAARMQAIGELGAADDEQFRLLCDGLSSGGAEERAVAAWALGRVGREEAVPLLLRSLAEDGSRDVRLNACSALGNFGGERVRQALIATLAEDDLQLRAAALRALSRPEFSAAADAVADVLLSGDAELKPLAVEALSEMLDPGNLAVFERVAREDPDEEVRSVAAFSLGKLRDPRAVPTLLALLEDEAWQVRANAVQALGMIGDRSAIPSIRAMLDDEHAQVQGAAELTLRRMDAEAAPPGGA